MSIIPLKIACFEMLVSFDVIFRGDSGDCKKMTIWIVKEEYKNIWNMKSDMQ